MILNAFNPACYDVPLININMNKTIILIISFIAGLGSTLYVATPFGKVAMFDLACYVFGPLFFVVNYKKFTRFELRILMLSFLWVIGAIYSNWWRQEPPSVALKGNAIVFNVWCMIVVGIWLLKKDYRTWLWFTVGNGISCVISLYYFQNGAYLFIAERAGFMGEGGMQSFLIDKQIYPIYTKFVLYALLLPLTIQFSIPWIVVISVLIFSAFYLLIRGGSRSNFGINLLSSFYFMGYAYFKRFTRMLLDNFAILCVVGIIVCSCIFNIYKDLALDGKLGQAEYNKFYSEMVDSDAGVLGSRDDIIRAWPFLKNHFFVGAGSSALDRWGYMKGDNIQLPGHSALVGAWVQNGIFGLFFWGYVLWMLMIFVQKRAMYFQSYAPFLVMKTVSLVWAILFSPFGGYRGEVSFFIALCVVAQDQNWIRRVLMMLKNKKGQIDYNSRLMRQNTSIPFRENMGESRQ